MYGNPSGAALDLNSNGAYGDKNKDYDGTKNGPWFIDYQKVGADAVIAGIYKNDVTTIERGMKIISWGLAQQKIDGSYSSEDPYHNSLLFLEAASRSVLHQKVITVVAIHVALNWSATLATLFWPSIGLATPEPRLRPDIRTFMNSP